MKQKIFLKIVAFVVVLGVTLTSYHGFSSDLTCHTYGTNYDGEKREEMIGFCYKDGGFAAYVIKVCHTGNGPCLEMTCNLNDQTCQFIPMPGGPTDPPH
jgi:hypothetical protein